MQVPGGEYLVFGLLTVLFGSLTVKYVRRLATLARTLRRGARTAGECVRVETEPYNRSDAKRHFFVFRTADGTEVEFEDLAGWGMKTGSPVTVTYDPENPRKTATIAGRGSWSPVLQCTALVAGCGMATIGFTTVLLFNVFGGQ
ncbi:DUF3592 domain-containing protein [Streptomyces sp. NPDC019443]|jgi:hypothetical protein|uniref:DUF3592 domain-containing protein n=1 Tax=Streptomyces sp. NPDC019443 TaxID=3365061 RepID=UPI00379A1982